MNKPPDLQLIKRMSAESRMPLCYGGGIKNVEQAKQIIALGVEKISLSSSAIHDTDLLKAVGKDIGIQSMVVSIDVKKQKFIGSEGYVIFTHNGKVNTGIELVDFIRKVTDVGIGEILINSIDFDGTMKGYDIELVDIARNSTDVPMTVLGGASSLYDIARLVARYRIIGAAAGSIFVFKGKYRAVLINYPSKSDKFRFTKINSDEADYTIS